MIRKNHSITLGLLLLATDQALKQLLRLNPVYTDGVFGITYFQNTQFAWSLPISNAISIVLMAFALLGLVWYLIFRAHHYSVGGLWIILLGAVSNFFDRVIYGGVIDYIRLPFGGIINIADCMVVLGGIIVFSAIQTRVKKN